MTSLRSSALAVLAAFAFATSAGATQVVVLDSKGSIKDKLPPGSVVDDTALDVPDHDQVTVMSATGETIQVNGPHKGPIGTPTGGDPSMLEKLSEVMIGFAPKKDDPWAIDATVDGTDCVFSGRPAKLWKPNEAKPVHVTLKDGTSGRETAFDWPAETSMVDWPASLPTVDGDSYTLQAGDASKAIKLKLAPTAANEGAGSLLAAQAGCAAQSRNLQEIAVKKAVKAP
jgi:hypothetical protein